MASLQNLQARTKADVIGTATVDISAFVEAEPGTETLTWREPDVPRLAEAQELAQAVKRAHPMWVSSVCLSVAILAVAHVAPIEDGDSPATFYASVAETNRDFWDFLNVEMAEKFPRLVGGRSALNEARESLERGDDWNTLHLCVTYLHRLPSECEGVTIGQLLQLAAYDEIRRNAAATPASDTSDLPE